MFYTHNITVVREEKTIDKSVYPPKETIASTKFDYTAFMDTPKTNEVLKYREMGKTLSRNLYIKYGVDIKDTDKIFFRGTEYKIVGDLENQGGQDEVIKIPLKRV